MNDASDLNWLHVGQKLKFIGTLDNMPGEIQPGGIYTVLEIKEHPVWDNWYGVVLTAAPEWVISLRDPGDKRYEPAQPSKPYTEYPLHWEPVDE